MICIKFCSDDLFGRKPGSALCHVPPCLSQDPAIHCLMSRGCLSQDPAKHCFMSQGCLSLDLAMHCLMSRVV